MATDKQLDRAISRWLEAEAPGQLPDRVLHATFERTRRSRQQRRWPTVLTRSLVTMNKLVPIAGGVAAVAIAVVLGSQLLGAGATGGVGAAPSAEPTAMPTPAPSTSATTSTPPLAQTFSSQLYGISVSYPGGWAARAATEPWTGAEVPIWTDPTGDVLYDPDGPVDEDHLFLTIASQPLGDSTPDEWVTERLSGATGCSTTEPITVDGAAGLMGTDPCDLMAAVTTAGRGYWIHLRTSDDDGEALAAYDRAWFEEVLATVQLQPEDAR